MQKAIKFLSKLIKKISPMTLLGIVILANIVFYLIFMLSLGVKLTFFGVVIDFLFIVFVFVCLNLIPGAKPRKIAYAVTTFLINAVMIADITYFYQFKAFASISSVPLVGNVVGQSFGIKIPWPGIFIIVLSVLFGASLFLLRLKTPDKWDRFKVKFCAFLAFTVLMLGVNVPYAVISSLAAEEYSFDQLEYIHSASYLYNEMYSSNKFVENFGYYTFRVRDVLYEPKFYISREDQIENFFSEREAEKQANSMTDILEGSNLITILGETFDQRFTDPDFIGARLNSLGPFARISGRTPLSDDAAGHKFSKIVSPNLYNLRKKAYVFDNYYVPTFFEGATINTEFMALNGVYALSASRNFTTSVGNDYYENYFGDYSLPGQLKAHGYDTYFMHNDSKSFYNRGVLMHNLGFDTLLFDEDLKAAGTTTERIYDTRLLEFIDLLEDDLTSGGKFYLHMDTYSMHTGNEGKYQGHLPRVEQAFKEIGINSKMVDKQLITYYCKVVEFDTFLGMLFDRLEELGLKDNTAVLLFPDHYFYTLDPALMERFIGIDPRDYDIHKNKLFLYSSRLQATKDNTLSSTIDITPTLLNMLLGDEANYKYFMSEDIFDDTFKTVSFSDITVFDGQVFLNADGTYIAKDNMSETRIRESVNALTQKQVEIIKEYEVAKAVFVSDFFYYLNPDADKAVAEKPPQPR